MVFSAGFGCFAGNFFSSTMPFNAILTSLSHSIFADEGSFCKIVSTSSARAFNLTKSRALWTSAVGASDRCRRTVFLKSSLEDEGKIKCWNAEEKRGNWRRYPLELCK